MTNHHGTDLIKDDDLINNHNLLKDVNLINPDNLIKDDDDEDGSVKEM